MDRMTTGGFGAAACDHNLDRPERCNAEEIIREERWNAKRELKAAKARLKRAKRALRALKANPGLADALDIVR